jgi:hypothetical protein
MQPISPAAVGAAGDGAVVDVDADSELVTTNRPSPAICDFEMGGGA